MIRVDVKKRKRSLDSDAGERNTVILYVNLQSTVMHTRIAHAPSCSSGTLGNHTRVPQLFQTWKSGIKDEILQMSNTIKCSYCTCKLKKGIIIY